jgi:hypothetical protein
VSEALIFVGFHCRTSLGIFTYILTDNMKGGGNTYLDVPIPDIIMLQNNSFTVLITPSKLQYVFDIHNCVIGSFELSGTH